MHALDHWRPFLLGRHFKVYTDHRSLVYLKTQPNLNQRQLRWMERAADYDCEILYKSGKENVIADVFTSMHFRLYLVTAYESHLLLDIERIRLKV